MSVPSMSGASRRFWLACGGVLLLALCLDAVTSHLMAQTPFGAPRPASTPAASGLVGWILDKQSEFYRQISATIRAAKADGRAVWTLVGLSFAYGIFHAAGPGHGKAVISSYLVANEETARRGILLSFVSAMMQALVAVGIVGIGAWLLNATASTMCSAERVIEIASYALIAAFGLRLVWTKGGAFIRALSAAPLAGAPALAAAGHPHDHGPVHGHAHEHHHGHGHAHGQHDHGHTHAHGHGPGCAGHDHAGHDHAAHGHAGHDHAHDGDCCAHGPEPAELAGPGGWRRGFGAVLAVGLRPCSGAILVLVFALAQGLFWAGIAATFAMGLGTAITVAAIAILAVSAKRVARRLSGNRPGRGALLLRGIEFAAAGLVLLFGLGLLLGYVGAERVTCL